MLIRLKVYNIIYIVNLMFLFIIIQQLVLNSLKYSTFDTNADVGALKWSYIGAWKSVLCYVSKIIYEIARSTQYCHLNIIVYCVQIKYEVNLWNLYTVLFNKSINALVVIGHFWRFLTKMNLKKIKDSIVLFCFTWNLKYSNC